MLSLNKTSNENIPKPRISDYYLQALADGELSEEDQKKIRSLMAERPEWRKRYEEIQLQKKMLKQWWDSCGDEH